jgi:hypothetical protein
MGKFKSKFLGGKKHKQEESATGEKSDGVVRK